MDKNRVTIMISGSQYSILTEDEPAYVEELGREVDEAVKEVTGDNPRVSLTQASVLVALDFADQAKKATAAADNLRAQIKDYLEDSARARMEVDVTRREIERLNRELSNARAKLSERK